MKLHIVSHDVHFLHTEPPSSHWYDEGLELDIKVLSKPILWLYEIGNDRIILREEGRWKGKGTNLSCHQGKRNKARQMEKKKYCQ